ncbi:G-protein coupled receptor Mth2 [Chionoecetes opilio]|uniref:G-protein coupled receptor Mth2 n=1 Tax=Chionoecetes opilio TaxID=41210 RepID=A0A8J5CQY8_CHIOP|nr:G-protein coupled receptor Mth2 [Chionoecetes opilio]
MICWFPDMESLWVHLYVWICFVMVTNILFFVMVMVILVKGQNNSLLRRSREMHRERMWLYVKLFLVMGVTWVAEMVSSRHGQCVGWLFTDIINALEGLTLFSSSSSTGLLYARYSNATTVDPSDLESAIPLGTLTEDQDESSHSEARGQDPQDTDTERHQPS